MSNPNPFSTSLDEYNPSSKRRTILTGFENYNRWSDETGALIRREGLWKYIDPGAEEPAPGTAARQRHDKETAAVEVFIKSSITDDIYKNIEGIVNPKTVWDTLKQICSQAGQGMVLTTLNQLLSQSANLKAKGFEVNIATRCGQASATARRLAGAVANPDDLWDAIKMAVVLQRLPSEYDHTVASILTTGDKKFSQVQQILGAEEQRIQMDREGGVKADLAMRVAHGKTPRGRQTEASGATCYSCNKQGHFSKDCWHNPVSARYRSVLPSKRQGTQINDSRPSKSRTRLTRGKASKTTAKQEDSEDSEREVANLTKVAEQRGVGKWYIDSCCSRHLTNDRSILESIKSQHILFDTANQGGSMEATEVGIATLNLPKGVTLRLPGVAYVPNATDNLISVGRLRDSGVTYHDAESGMLLKQYGRPIALAKREGNLFAMNVIRKEKAMSAKGRPTYLQGTIAEQQLWHRRFGHASHARVAKASRM